MTEQANVVEKKSNEGRDRACPGCGKLGVQVEVCSQPFLYGEGDRAVELTATVPLYSCSACGLQFLDRIGEERRHEAVCAYHGVLTPKQIRALRKKHRMSRSEFARATSLGEATLARWERGQLIQNQAYDRYLRLLQDNANFERVCLSANVPRSEPDAATIGPDLPRTTTIMTVKNFRSGLTRESFSPSLRSYTPLRRRA